MHIGKQRVRDNDAPTSNVAKASASSAPVHPQTRKVRKAEIPGSDVKGAIILLRVLWPISITDTRLSGKKRARDVEDERPASQEKTVASMVEGGAQSM